MIWGIWMGTFRTRAAGAAVALCAFGMVSSASAADIVVTSVGVDSWNQATVAGYGSFTATGIIFDTALLDPFVVFCVDLQHHVNVGATNYQYNYGPLEVTGIPSPISAPTSNVIGQLANIGAAYWAQTNASLGGHRSQYLTAVQAAIWALEYNTTASTGDAFTNARIADYVALTDNGRGRALALISLDGHQNMVPGGSVPEPAAWALMISGFGMVGVMLRRRRTVFA